MKRNIKIPLSKKTLAGLLAVMTFLQSGPWASASEISFWKERRKALEMTRQPGHGHSSKMARLSPIAKSGLNPSVLQANFNFLPFSQSVPLDNKFPDPLEPLASFGTVSEIHLSPKPGAPWVILIQDAHGIPEAQRNIAAMVRQLTQSGQVSFTAVEGAEGWFDWDTPRRCGTEGARQKVTEEFVDHSLLTGVELAGLTSPRPPRVLGVEDQATYQQHMEALRRSQPLRDKVDHALETWQEELTVQARRVSPPLSDWLSHVRAYETGTESLTEHVHWLGQSLNLSFATSEMSGTSDTPLSGRGAQEDSRPTSPKVNSSPQGGQGTRSLSKNAIGDLRPRSLPRATSKLKKAPPSFPQLTLFGALLHLESARNPALLALEKRSLMNRLSRLLSPQELRELASCFQSGGHPGDIDEKMWALMERLMSEHSFPGDYPQLTGWLRSLQLGFQLKRVTLLEEIRLAQRSLLLEEERFSLRKPWAQLCKDLWVLSHMTRHSLTSQEWEEVSGSIPDLVEVGQRLSKLAGRADLPRLTRFDLNPLVDFYSLAEKRNAPLAQHTLRSLQKEGGERALLIAGGFHTRGLLRLFKDQGLSYAVMTPRFTSLPSGNYLDLFFRDSYPLEQFLGGKKVTLVSPLAFGPNASSNTLARRIRDAWFNQVVQQSQTSKGPTLFPKRRDLMAQIKGSLSLPVTQDVLLAMGANTAIFFGGLPAGSLVWFVFFLLHLPNIQDDFNLGGERRSVSWRYRYLGGLALDTLTLTLGLSGPSLFVLLSPLLTAGTVSVFADPLISLTGGLVLGLHTSLLTHRWHERKLPFVLERLQQSNGSGWGAATPTVRIETLGKTFEQILKKLPQRNSAIISGSHLKINVSKTQLISLLYSPREEHPFNLARFFPPLSRDRGPVYKISPEGSNWVIYANHPVLGIDGHTEEVEAWLQKSEGQPLHYVAFERSRNSERDPRWTLSPLRMSGGISNPNSEFFPSHLLPPPSIQWALSALTDHDPALHEGTSGLDLNTPFFPKSSNPLFPRTLARDPSPPSFRSDPLIPILRARWEDFFMIPSEDGRGSYAFYLSRAEGLIWFAGYEPREKVTLNEHGALANPTFYPAKLISQWEHYLGYLWEKRWDDRAEDFLGARLEKRSDGPWLLNPFRPHHWMRRKLLSPEESWIFPWMKGDPIIFALKRDDTAIFLFVHPQDKLPPSSQIYTGDYGVSLSYDPQEATPVHPNSIHEMKIENFAPFRYYIQEGWVIVEPPMDSSTQLSVIYGIDPDNAMDLARAINVPSLTQELFNVIGELIQSAHQPSDKFKKPNYRNIIKNLDLAEETNPHFSELLNLLNEFLPDFPLKVQPAFPRPQGLLALWGDSVKTRNAIVYEIFHGLMAATVGSLTLIVFFDLSTLQVWGCSEVLILVGSILAHALFGVRRSDGSRSYLLFPNKRSPDSDLSRASAKVHWGEAMRDALTGGLILFASLFLPTTYWHLGGMLLWELGPLPLLFLLIPFLTGGGIAIILGISFHMNINETLKGESRDKSSAPRQRNPAKDPSEASPPKSVDNEPSEEMATNVAYFFLEPPERIIHHLLPRLFFVSELRRHLEGPDNGNLAGALEALLILQRSWSLSKNAGKAFESLILPLFNVAIDTHREFPFLVLIYINHLLLQLKTRNDSFLSEESILTSLDELILKSFRLGRLHYMEETNYMLVKSFASLFARHTPTLLAPKGLTELSTQSTTKEFAYRGLVEGLEHNNRFTENEKADFLKEVRRSWGIQSLPEITVSEPVPPYSFESERSFPSLKDWVQRTQSPLHYDRLSAALDFKGILNEFLKKSSEESLSLLLTGYYALLSDPDRTITAQVIKGLGSLPFFEPAVLEDQRINGLFGEEFFTSIDQIKDKEALLLYLMLWIEKAPSTNARESVRQRVILHLSGDPAAEFRNFLITFLIRQWSRGQEEGSQPAPSLTIGSDSFVYSCLTQCIVHPGWVRMIESLRNEAIAIPTLQTLLTQLRDPNSRSILLTVLDQTLGTQQSSGDPKKTWPLILFVSHLLSSDPTGKTWDTILSCIKPDHNVIQLRPTQSANPSGDPHDPSEIQTRIEGAFKSRLGVTPISRADTLYSIHGPTLLLFLGLVHPEVFHLHPFWPALTLLWAPVLLVWGRNRGLRQRVLAMTQTWLDKKTLLSGSLSPPQSLSGVATELRQRFTSLRRRLISA